MSELSLVTTHACQPGTVRGRGILVGGHTAKEQLVYTNGKSVVLRSLRNPMLCDMYTEHGYAATVARFSPNGEWVASADTAGNVRVWASHTLGCEHVLKCEHRPLSASIDDMQWSADGQRIAVCGDGKETRAKCIMWDSGNPVGSFDGIAKRCNSIDFKPTRPLRIVTGAEDFKVNFYEGPPFKFQASQRSHTNFVNCVRYSADGERVLSVGSDYKGLLYDGKTGDVIVELPTGQNGAGHTGSVYSAHWSADNKQAITASADKTLKLWDLAGAAPTVVTTFTVASKPQVEHMQVGSFWYGEFMGSISLSGDLNYFDPRVGSSPVKVVSGHSKTVTALTAAPSDELYSASYDGVINRWTPEGGCKGKLNGKGHGTGVSGLCATAFSSSLISTGLDDKIMFTKLPAEEYGNPVPLAGCPADLGIAADGETGVVVTNKGIQLIRGSAVLSTTPTSYDATCASISADGSEVAVGGSDNKVYMYEVKGDSLREVAQLDRHRGALTCVSYSPDGSKLASADANREVLVWDCATKEVKHSKMAFHSARVQCCAWSPNSTKLATGSLDLSIIVWDLSTDTPTRIQAARAHVEGVTRLAFLGDSKLVSGGADACLRVWSLA